MDMCSCRRITKRAEYRCHGTPWFCWSQKFKCYRRQCRNTQTRTRKESASCCAGRISCEAATVVRGHALRVHETALLDRMENKVSYRICLVLSAALLASTGNAEILDYAKYPD